MRAYKIDGERVTKAEFWAAVREELPAHLSKQEYRRVQDVIWNTGSKRLGGKVFQSINIISP